MKIKDSKGNIYDSCPYINSIQELCSQQQEIIGKIVNELEKVRAINQELRNSDKREEVAQKEVWEEVGDIFNIVRCNERDLKNLNKEYEDFQKQIKELESEVSDLKSTNKDLLEQIQDLTNN